MACYTCGREGHVARECRQGTGARGGGGGGSGGGGARGGGGGGGGGGSAAVVARLVANPITSAASGGGGGMGSLDSRFFDQPALWNFLRLSIVVSTYCENYRNGGRSFTVTLRAMFLRALGSSARFKLETPFLPCT